LHVRTTFLTFCHGTTYRHLSHVPTATSPTRLGRPDQKNRKNRARRTSLGIPRESEEFAVNSTTIIHSAQNGKTTKLSRDSVLLPIRHTAASVR
jgi:hypothetical protein